MAEHLDSEVGTPSRDGGGSWLQALLGQRIVQVTLVVWVTANVVVLAVAPHRPRLCADAPPHHSRRRREGAGTGDCR